ncbi:hypothetical protein Tco_0637827 [Tanacetum coccineum]
MRTIKETHFRETMQEEMLVSLECRKGHRRECPRPKRLQDSDYFKDQAAINKAQENGAVVWDEKRKNIFKADELLMPFDSDVDAGYPIHRPYEYHEVHEMQNDVQHNYVVDSDADYTSDVILFRYDRCSKHMTGNRSKLMNFVEKFIGTVRFGNDIRSYLGIWSMLVVKCDLRKHTCFVRDINGADILKGSRGTNLYMISIDEIMKSSPICLLSKASKSKSWLWHPEPFNMKPWNKSNQGSLQNDKELEMLFQPLFLYDDLEKSESMNLAPSATEVNVKLFTSGYFFVYNESSDAPSTSASSSTSDMHHLVRHQGNYLQEGSICQSDGGLETGKSYSRLSSEEGSLWAKAGTKGVKYWAMDLSDPVITNGGSIETGTRISWDLVDKLDLEEWWLHLMFAYSQFKKKVKSGGAQFLGDRLVSAWSSKKQRSTPISIRGVGWTSPCPDVVLKSFGCDPSSKTTDLTSIKFLCTVITKVLLLFAVTTSSTHALNTLTYGTISSESKWKIEWLNSTSWKRTINLQTSSPKHYQENGSNFFFHA